MGRPEPAASAFLALTALLGGCATKLDFDAVSRDRSSQRADGGASEDGGVSELRPGPDGAADLSSPDSGLITVDAVAPLADGGGDGPTADAGTAGTLAEFTCKGLVPPAQFCDDFEALNLASRWSVVDVYPVSSGLIDIDQTEARFGKGSLLAELYESIDACENCIHALVHHDLDALDGATRITVEFDLRVEVIDPGLSRRVGLFQVGFGDNQLLSLELASTGAHVTADFVEYDLPAQATVATRFHHDAFAVPAIDQWVHVRLVLDVTAPSGAGNSAVLQIDDTTLFTGVLQNALRGGLPFVELGLPWLDQSQLSSDAPNQSWQARFDDFVLRVEAE